MHHDYNNNKSQNAPLQSDSDSSGSGGSRSRLSMRIRSGFGLCSPGNRALIPHGNRVPFGAMERLWACTPPPGESLCSAGSWPVHCWNSPASLPDHTRVLAALLLLLLWRECILAHMLTTCCANVSIIETPTQTESELNPVYGVYRLSEVIQSFSE